MRVIGKGETDGVHSPFHDVIARWYDAKKEKAVPSINDFLNGKPDDIAPYRILSTVTTEPLCVHYYNVGRALEELYGHSLVGKNLDELYNSFFRKRAYEGYIAMMDAALPIYEQRTFSTIIGKIGYYKIHLPFGEDKNITSAATYIMPTNAFRKRFDWESLIKKTPWF